MHNRPGDFNPYLPLDSRSESTGQPGWQNEPLANPPAVIFWCKVYITCMLMLYLLVAIAGILILIFADQIAAASRDDSPAAFQVMGTVYSLIGIFFSGVFAVGLYWQRGNGAWIYQLILIVIGLTSCITWPATIPLMIYWIKDRENILRSRG